MVYYKSLKHIQRKWSWSTFLKKKKKIISGSAGNSEKGASNSYLSTQ